jgi:hypothetical protein
MEVNKIQKKIRVNPYDVVKFQVITELIFFRNLSVIPSDVELLSLIALWGPMELSAFCAAAARHIYTEAKPEDLSVRAQNVRNRIVKLEKRKLVLKSSGGKKQISINPDLNIHAKGNILLDYNILAIESTKT